MNNHRAPPGTSDPSSRRERQERNNSNIARSNKEKQKASESVTDGTKREGISDYETTDRTGSQGHGTVNSFRQRKSYIRKTYRNQGNSNFQSNKS